MTDEEMRKEMGENSIVDNPFDLLMYNSMELVRSLLFACVRYRNKNIPDNLQISEESLRKRFDHILNEFTKLGTVSNETCDMLRETSYYGFERERFDQLNEKLLKYERLMETVYTRCNPNRLDRYEKIRLGENSEEYKRLHYLQSIRYDEIFSPDTLGKMIDIITRPDEVLKNDWVSEKEFEHLKGIIDKYNFSEKDIQYLEAYMYQK